MTISEISEPVKTEIVREKIAASGSDVRLARFFLISVLVAGLASYLLGFSAESAALFPCPFHLITGVECPGCGMTRACIALSRGDLSRALSHNPLSIGLVLFAAAFALAPVKVRRNWARLTPGTRRIAKCAALVTVMAFWIYRILP